MALQECIFSDLQYNLFFLTVYRVRVKHAQFRIKLITVLLTSCGGVEVILRRQLSVKLNYCEERLHRRVTGMKASVKVQVYGKCY